MKKGLLLITLFALGLFLSLQTAAYAGNCNGGTVPGICVELVDQFGNPILSNSSVVVTITAPGANAIGANPDYVFTGYDGSGTDEGAAGDGYFFVSETTIVPATAFQFNSGYIVEIEASGSGYTSVNRTLSSQYNGSYTQSVENNATPNSDPTVAVTGLQVNLKITLTDELANNLSDLGVSTGQVTITNTNGGTCDVTNLGEGGGGDVDTGGVDSVIYMKCGAVSTGDSFNITLNTVEDNMIENATTGQLSSQAQAVVDAALVYPVLVKVTDELNSTTATNPIDSATIVSAGTGAQAADADGTTYWAYYMAVVGGTSSEITSVAQDGYVQQGPSVLGAGAVVTTSGTAQIVQDFTGGSGLPFAYQVADVTREQDAATLLGGAITAAYLGSGAGGAAHTGVDLCIESAGNLYCPVLKVNSGAATSLWVEADGYVAEALAGAVTTRTLDSDLQVAWGTAANVKFGYVVDLLPDELGNNILASATAMATGNSGGTACIMPGGAGTTGYCPTPIGEATAISATVPGFVADSTAIGWTSARTTNYDAQVVASTDPITGGLLYAYRLNAILEELNNNIMDGTETVASGNAAGTACTYDAGTTAFYCPVPIGESLGIQVTKGGYVEDTTSLTFANARVAATDGQETATTGGILYGYKITAITTEDLLADVLGGTTTLSVGDVTGTDACTLNGAGTIWYCPVALANSDGVLVGAVARDGYVSPAGGYALTAGVTRLTNAAGQQSDTIANVQYAYTITGITSEVIGTALLTTATAVSLGDASGKNSCTLNSGTGNDTWYCPVIVDNSNGALLATVTQEGYVEEDITPGVIVSRTAAADAQQAGGTLSNVKYAYKINSILTEGPANDITVLADALSVGNSTGLDACTRSGATWYCPVVLANSSGTVFGAITEPGYVTGTTAGGDTLTTATARAANTTAQVISGITGVKFSYKLATVATDAGTNIASSNPTVKTGSAQTITCTNSSNVYYCLVPINPTSVAIQVTLDGYVQDLTSYAFATTRTATTDAQVTATTGAVKNAYKITLLQTEATNSDITATATALAVGDATGTNACTLNAGAWYCPVVLANSDGVLQGTATADGYVSAAINLTTGTTRLTNAAAQLSDTVTNIQYAYTVNAITTEGPALSLTTSATLALGDNTGTNACTFNTATWYCPVVLANSDGTMIGVVTKDGYVNNSDGLTAVTTLGGNRTLSTSAQNAGGAVGTVTSVDFAYKVTDVFDELGTSLAANTGVQIWTPSAAGTLCLESANVWYCPKSTADSNLTIYAAVGQPGGPSYVTNTSNSFAGPARTANSDAQQSATVGDGTGLNGMQFTLKLVANTELGSTGDIITTDIDDLATLTYDGSGRDDISGTNVAYWAAATDTAGALAVGQTGFVNAAVTNTGLASFTPVDTAQTVITMADNTNAALGGVSAGTNNTAIGLQYALKVTVADQQGLQTDSNLQIANLDTFTFNGSVQDQIDGTDPYTAYFISTAAAGNLVIREGGYVYNESTNAGYAGIDLSSSDTAGQTVVDLGANAALAVAPVAGSNSLSKGMEYGILVNVTDEFGTVPAGMSVSSILIGGNSAVSGASSPAAGTFYFNVTAGALTHAITTTYLDAYETTTPLNEKLQTVNPGTTAQTVVNLNGASSAACDGAASVAAGATENCAGLRWPLTIAVCNSGVCDNAGDAVTGITGLGNLSNFYIFKADGTRISPTASQFYEVGNGVYAFQVDDLTAAAANLPAYFQTKDVDDDADPYVDYLDSTFVDTTPFAADVVNAFNLTLDPAPDYLTLAGSAAWTAGTAETFTIVLRDNDGNTVTTGASATLPITVTVVESTGGATPSALTLANGTGSPLGGSVTTTVNTITGELVAGVGEVLLSSTLAGTDLKVTVDWADGSLSQDFNLNSVVDLIAVSPAAADHIVLSNPNLGAVGNVDSTQTFDAKVYDQYENFRSSDTGAVTLTASAGGTLDDGTSSGSTITTNINAGTSGSISIGATAPGTYTIDVDSTTVPNADTTPAVQVDAAFIHGAADHFTVTNVATATTDETVSIRLDAFDQYENAINDDSVTRVTVAVSGDGNNDAKITDITIGSLTSGINTNSVNLVLGSGAAEVTLSDISAETVSITVTCPNDCGWLAASLGGATQVDSSVDFLPGAVASLQVVAPMTAIAAGDSFSVVVTALDAQSNVSVSATNTISIASDDPYFDVTANDLAPVSGVATFTVTLGLASSASALTVSSGSLSTSASVQIEGLDITDPTVAVAANFAVVGGAGTSQTPTTITTPFSQTGKLTVVQVSIDGELYDAIMYTTTDSDDLDMQIPADGSTLASVSATLRDKYSNVVQGGTVHLVYLGCSGHCKALPGRSAADTVATTITESTAVNTIVGVATTDENGEVSFSVPSEIDGTLSFAVYLVQSTDTAAAGSAQSSSTKIGSGIGASSISLNFKPNDTQAPEIAITRGSNYYGQVATEAGTLHPNLPILRPGDTIDDVLTSETFAILVHFEDLGTVKSGFDLSTASARDSHIDVTFAPAADGSGRAARGLARNASATCSGGESTGGFTLSAADAIECYLSDGTDASTLSGTTEGPVDCLIYPTTTTTLCDGTYDVEVTVSDLNGQESAPYTITPVYVGARTGAVDGVANVLNGPNPFNPYAEDTLLTFQASNAPSYFQYVIFDRTGREIQTIRVAASDAAAGDIIGVGYNQTKWNGKNSEGDVVGQGIYFYKLIVDGSEAGKGKIAVTKH